MHKFSEKNNDTGKLCTNNADHLNGFYHFLQHFGSYIFYSSFYQHNEYTLYLFFHFKDFYSDSYRKKKGVLIRTPSIYILLFFEFLIFNRLIINHLHFWILLINTLITLPTTLPLSINSFCLIFPVN